MKILYIGHYRNGLNNGWARCSKDQILALDSVGIDVAIRPVILGTNEMPEELKPFEEKSAAGYDVCIQHLLPHHMEKIGKCIGSFVCDSSSIRYSSWASHLKAMDKVWVANSQMAEVCNEFEIIPELMPHTVDPKIYDFNGSINLPDGFNFYSIIDFSKRKNLIALLKAFHLEFKNEPVNLVLKVGKFGVSEEQMRQEINAMSSKVKQSLRINPDLNSFKQEVVITNTLTDEQIKALHNTCDAYVCTSYEEAWCYPLFDAMGFGNIVISNDISGPREYIEHHNNGYLVDNMETPCFGAEGFSDVYTGYETWKDINIQDLMNYMRLAFCENHDDMRKKARERVKDFSYEKVGEQMLEACAI